MKDKRETDDFQNRKSQFIDAPSVGQKSNANSHLAHYTWFAAGSAQ